MKDIIISEGHRSYWQTFLAAIFFTLTVACLIFAFYPFENNFSLKIFKGHIEVLELGIFLFVTGLRFSLVYNIHFDLQLNRYKKEYAVGAICIGKWQKLPRVEYISVFRQLWSSDRDGDGITDARGHKYDVNVWHSTSKHFTIYSCDELEPAYEMAKHIALKLETDFLDATIPNDFKWVELKTVPLE